MESVSDQLLAALDELVSDQLKRFKWHLRNDCSVSASDLEKVVDAPDTVDLMMVRFGPEEAVANTVKILRKMKLNLLAEELEKKHQQAQTENSREDPAGFESKPVSETLPNIVPRTRKDLLQYYLRPTLDLNTLNKHLDLSQNNREIIGMDPEDVYPAHPDRFDHAWQVLCGESVSGRCYWEIECRDGGMDVAVSYKSIRRKGQSDKCVFGRNAQSWSLSCSPFRYSFWHNNIETDLSKAEDDDDDDDFDFTYRVGVFVDPGAGILSFYKVSDTVSLIHTVQTTFTQPLYPGFGVGIASSVKLC